MPGLEASMGAPRQDGRDLQVLPRVAQRGSAATGFVSSADGVSVTDGVSAADDQWYSARSTVSSTDSAALSWTQCMEVSMANYSTKLSPDRHNPS